MAVVTQHSSTTASAAQQARHIALPILALGVVIAILYLGRLFFITSLIALTIAFILEPFVALLMRIRFPRSLASFVVCSFALALLYVIGLGAYSQLAGLYDELPKYGQHIGELVDGVQQRISAMEEQTYKVVSRRGSGRKKSAGSRWNWRWPRPKRARRAPPCSSPRRSRGRSPR